MANMGKTENEFQYIKEDDYKTLISIYQQKTFDLFNQNIALEAKVSTLNSLVKQLNETIEEMIKVQEKNNKKSSRSRSKSQNLVSDTVDNSTLASDNETF